MMSVCLGLAACGSPNEDTSSATIANRAESLERAADATTNRLIAEIEASAAEEAEEAASDSAQQESSGNRTGP